MKKFFILTVLMATFTLVLAACGNESEGADKADSSDKEQITLNIGHTLTLNSPYHKLGEKFKEEIEASTDGRVKVTLYPSSQLGGELDMIQAVRGGTQDMVIAAQATLENTIPEWQIFSLPFLFKNLDEANKVLQSETGDKYLSLLEDYNMKGLGWLSAIERDVFGNKDIDIANMDGFKIRLMQSPGYIAAYEALGATPTPMAYSELYVSLQQGVVDGGDTSPDQFVQDKFAEVTDYFYLSKIHYLPATIAMNLEKWNSFDSELQGKIEEAMKVAIDFEIDYYKKAYDKGIEDLKKEGVEVIEVDTTEAKEKTESVRQELLKEIPNGEELYEEIQNAK